MTEYPKWEVFAALAQQCAVRFDAADSHERAAEARQLRADFLWAASDPVRAKKGVIEQWSARLRELIAESRGESEHDSGKPTPRQSGTLQMAPDFAAEARETQSALIAFRGSALLARDRCQSPEVSSELSARILSAEELIDTLGEYAEDLESWGTRDPGPEQRPMRVNRLAQALRRANDLLKATPAEGLKPPAIELVRPRGRWPF